MKKIVLTEKQVKSLVSTIVEQVPAIPEDNIQIEDGKYKVECNFSFDVNDYTTYKNGEIDGFTDSVGVISYRLDVDYQPYGIQSIKVADIQYPPALNTTVTFYPEGSSSEDEDWYEKRQEEQIKIPMDWRRTKTYSWDDGTQINYIGVGKKANVEVKPDGQGGLVGYVDEIDIRELNSEDQD